jgi:hypothetical protein
MLLAYVHSIEPHFTTSLDYFTSLKLRFTYRVIDKKPCHDPLAGLFLTACLFHKYPLTSQDSLRQDLEVWHYGVLKCGRGIESRKDSSYYTSYTMTGAIVSLYKILDKLSECGMFQNHPRAWFVSGCDFANPVERSRNRRRS